MPQEKAIYQLAVRTTVQVLSGGAVLMGALVAWGGPGRFATASLATARLVPGGAYAWAAAIAGGGIFTCAGIAARWRRPVVCAGLAWQGAWYAFLDLSLWTTALHDPTTPLIGAVVYAMLAALCAVLYAAGHELHAREAPPP
jgi:hypothetical protein